MPGRPAAAVGNDAESIFADIFMATHNGPVAAGIVQLPWRPEKKQRQQCSGKAWMGARRMPANLTQALLRFHITIEIFGSINIP